MLNIRDICKTKTSKYWKKSAEDGMPGWQRITVALIVDGLEAMDKSVLDLLATVGVYQDGIMKRNVDGKDTVAHIFEVRSFSNLCGCTFDVYGYDQYTTQLSIDSTPALVYPHGDDANNLVPVQIVGYSLGKEYKTYGLIMLEYRFSSSKLKIRRRSTVTDGSSTQLEAFCRYREV